MKKNSAAMYTQHKKSARRTNKTSNAKSFSGSNEKRVTDSGSKNDKINIEEAQVISQELPRQIIT